MILAVQLERLPKGGNYAVSSLAFARGQSIALALQIGLGVRAVHGVGFLDEEERFALLDCGLQLDAAVGRGDVAPCDEDEDRVRVSHVVAELRDIV